jgi:polyisoprenoid-binding protein YceI
MPTSRQTRWILTGTLGVALLAGSAVLAQDGEKPSAEGRKPIQSLHPRKDAAPQAAAPGKIEYRAQNSMFKAHGEFTSWRFTKVTMPEGKIEGGSVELEIDTASITANNPKLNEHLKASDMLNVAQFPKATIKVHSATPVAGSAGMYSAKADVTILGITKTVPIEFTVEGAEEKTVTGTATINRDDFKVYVPSNPSDPKVPEANVAISFTAKLPKGS